MTLLDAPAFNERRARIVKWLWVTAVVVFFAAFAGTILYELDVPWQLWNLRPDHRVNVFFDDLQAQQYKKAYAEWQNDPNWQKHPQEYSNYPFSSFMRDWGPESKYGKITSHRIVVAKPVGNGVVIGVDVNGSATPVFLRVDDRTKEIGFSPIELYVGQ